MNKKITKAVIPAAGLGTRFLPASKAIPKEMFPIVDTPCIQLIVEEAVKSGIKDILFIVSSSKSSVENHFDYNFELEEKLFKKKKDAIVYQLRNIADQANFYFLRQKQTLGLGHAILKAESFIGDEPFAILLGDDVVYNKTNQALEQCMNAFYQTKSSIVGVQQVIDADVHKYGIVKPVSGTNSNDLVQLSGMVEKPDIKNAPSNLAILGRYVLTPQIFEELKNTKVDIRDEIELTDAILSLLKKEKVYAKVFSGTRYDIGSKVGYVKATIDYALRDTDIADEIKSFIKNKK